MGGPQQRRPRPEPVSWRDILAMILAMYQLVVLPFVLLVAVLALLVWGILRIMH